MKVKWKCTAFHLNSLHFHLPGKQQRLNINLGAHGAKADVYSDVSSIEVSQHLDALLDWYGAEVFDISGDMRVSMHNQDNCTPASQVGPWYGNICAQAGATALRSVWVACPGQKLSAGNTTVADADQAKAVSAISCIQILGWVSNR
ncbi:hypothetical protein BJ165DRAFT_1612235 [Panaeolus papilionaceus]|nr:hypothetical protein BJ165DRAFT_1612235 [Panaeolus papilionaceus]